jgi:hypothetical protein
MSRLRTYVPYTASYSGAQKSIWDHYIDMARGVDALRETELTELADTVLVFVNSVFRFILQCLYCFVGRIVRCISLRFPHIHHHPTPTEQHRYLKRHPPPHISPTQQLLLSRLCRATVHRSTEGRSHQHSPLYKFGSRPH